MGKGTLVAKLRQRVPSLGLAVSATTRSPREGETEGVSYYFLDKEEFEARVAAGEFLEWASVHGNCYGTLKSEVERLFGEGRSVVLEIDVQGGLNVRRENPGAVLVFIDPPSLEVLEERLRGRGTEDEDTIELRLKNAASEFEAGRAYDAHIVNDDLDRACAELADLINTYETKGRSL